MIKKLSFLLIMLLLNRVCLAQEGFVTEGDSNVQFRSVSIPIEITVACEEQRYQVSWFLDQLDSADLPELLLFKGFRYDESDHSRIDYRTQTLDSQQVQGSPYIWVGSPGYYWLEYTDSARRIHYSSDQVHIELCSRFQLADKFVIGTGKFYKPVYSQNIEKIELVIFDSYGQEVFTTQNPNFKWDGRNMQTLEPCPPGSYFYHCDVFENKSGKMTKRNITGIIEITH